MTDTSTMSHEGSSISMGNNARVVDYIYSVLVCEKNLFQIH